MSQVPETRIEALNAAEPRADGEFVLYWMTSARRTRSNFALDRAVEWARRYKKPLVVLEALRCDYPWASDRLHRFVMDGMVDNLRELAKHNVTYYPYVEPRRGAGKGLLEELGKRACVVITDTFPCFFVPRMHRAAAERLQVLLEGVDTNGLLPLSAAPKPFHRAVDFRRFLQRELRNHLAAQPKIRPLSRLSLPDLKQLPSRVRRRWPATKLEDLEGSDLLESLPVDHGVGPTDSRGGMRAASQRLKSFIEESLADYGDGRNDPAQGGTSTLSAHLHFGHIASAEVFQAVTRRFDWTLDDLAEKANGAREGWWGLPEGAESFLDQIVTWRELGYVFCDQVEDYGRYETLPEWARITLEDHLTDDRPHLYDLKQLEEAGTDDEIWNAAQRELVREGRIHNYLRMLWGKRLLEWTRHPEEAVQLLIELNNRYALDGRNPNSYSGIMWTFGRFDRAWGPERPIYGKVRYMSSANTRRKLRLEDYLERHGPAGHAGQT